MKQNIKVRKISVTYVYQVFHNYFEITIWITGLTLLAFMSPENTHISLCPLKATGIGFCPGCGLGHSISWLMHGNFKESFNAHPLGVFALLMLTYRIMILIRNLYKN